MNEIEDGMSPRSKILILYSEGMTVTKRSRIGRPTRLRPTMAFVQNRTMRKICILPGEISRLAALTFINSVAKKRVIGE
jgi:hypothetical protein